MPSFTFTSPEGKSYTVDGPEGSTKEQAWMVLQAKLGAQPKENPIGEGRAWANSGLRGIPILGAAADQATAGLNAMFSGSGQGMSDAPNFGDRYHQNLDKIRGGTNQYESEHPYYSGIAKAAIGAAALAPAIAAAPELMGARGVAQVVNGARVAPSTASMMLDGGLAGGALGGTDAWTRGGSAGDIAKGTMWGGALGAGMPALMSGAGYLGGALWNNTVGRYRASANPNAYGDAQVAKMMADKGVNPAAIDAEVQRAAAEGQPEFTRADAMGLTGQRALSPLARTPGPQREMVVNPLDARQMDQGRRVVNTVQEGFDTRATPAQQRARMEESRGAVSDINYGNARNGAGRVDVVPAINSLDRNIGTEFAENSRPIVTPANDSVEAVLTPFRQRLARVNPDDFEAVQRIRGDMNDLAMANPGTNRARLLGQAIRALDDEMENAAPGFRQANRDHRMMSRDIDAIAEGQARSQNGRIEDTLDAYNSLGPRGQQAFRTGYADKFIRDAQGAEGPTTNRARFATSPAFQEESAAIAPRNELMQRKLNRENIMHETRRQATGGSQTADNLADQEAQNFDPHLVTQVLAGHWRGALQTMVAHGSNMFNGVTPAAKQRIAQILMQNGRNLQPGQLQQLVDQAAQRLEALDRMAAGMRRTAQTVTLGGGLNMGRSQ